MLDSVETTDCLVDEVELQQENPHYASAYFSGGKETSLSVKPFPLDVWDGWGKRESPKVYIRSPYLTHLDESEMLKNEILCEKLFPPSYGCTGSWRIWLPI